jgi:hypothetical protein
MEFSYNDHTLIKETIMKTACPFFGRVLSAVFAGVLWLSSSATAAGVARIEAVGTPVLPDSPASAVGVLAPGDLGGARLDSNLGSSSLTGPQVAPVPGLIPVTAVPVAPTVSQSMPPSANLQAAPAPQTGAPQAATPAQSAQDRLKDIAGKTAALADPKATDATVKARAFFYDYGNGDDEDDDDFDPLAEQDPLDRIPTSPVALGPASKIVDRDDENFDPLAEQDPLDRIPTSPVATGPSSKIVDKDDENFDPLARQDPLDRIPAGPVVPIRRPQQP